MAICRFCHVYIDTYNRGSNDYIKYSTRHYAHTTCYLDQKGIIELNARQLRNIHWRLLHERGLLEQSEAVIKASMVEKM